MFKELFENKITITIGKTYVTNNKSIVKAIKKSGLPDQGYHFIECEVIESYDTKKVGSLKKYTKHGVPSGFQNNSDKYIKQWTINSEYKENDV